MHKSVKKALALILAVVITLGAVTLPAAADETGICFTAVDDKVLDLSLMPVFVGGNPYLPWTVFNYFGVSTSYFSSVNTALLSYGNTQIMFDLNEGTCYDANNNYYPLSGVSMYGTIYVPAWTGSIFGLSYSYINGIGTGDVVRVKSGGQVLSDSQFIDAAYSTMKTMYNSSYGAQMTPVPEESAEPDISGGSVALCFAGAPTAELLDVFKNYGAAASFFVTEEQARLSGDLLRRAFCEGHSLGVFCTSEKEQESAMEALSRAVFIRPTLATGYADNTQASSGKDKGLAVYSPSRIIYADQTDPSVINLGLSTDGSFSDCLIYVGEHTADLAASVCGYIAANGYTPIALRETYL